MRIMSIIKVSKGKYTFYLRLKNMRDRFEDKKDLLTSALSRSISNHDATYSDGHQGSSRVRCILLLDRRNFRHKPRDDACREKRASCHVRCNQTQCSFKISFTNMTRVLDMRVRDQVPHTKPQVYQLKLL